jgi:hypothetical protein
MATKLGGSPDGKRFGGGRAVLAEARDRLIRHTVGKAGYRPTEVAAFLICHFSNITQALLRKGKMSK